MPAMVSSMKKEAFNNRKLKLIRDLRIFSRIENQVSTPKSSQKEDQARFIALCRAGGYAGLGFCFVSQPTVVQHGFRVAAGLCGTGKD